MLDASSMQLCDLTRLSAGRQLVGSLGSPLGSLGGLLGSLGRPWGALGDCCGSLGSPGDPLGGHGGARGSLREALGAILRVVLTIVFLSFCQHITCTHIVASILLQQMPPHPYYNIILNTKLYYTILIKYNIICGMRYAVCSKPKTANLANILNI